MTRAGLIGAVVIFLFASMISGFGPALAVTCCVIPVGLGAGYLSAFWDRPQQQREAVRKGTIGGAISGVGVILGHVVGAVLSVVFRGDQLTDFSRAFSSSFGVDASRTSEVWTYVGIVIGQGCIGLFGLALIIGLGALGGVIWWQTTGKNQGGAVAA